MAHSFNDGTFKLLTRTISDNINRVNDSISIYDYIV